MKKKEYMAPTTETVHIEAKYTFLQISGGYDEPQQRSLRYHGDDEGWGEGE